MAEDSGIRTDALAARAWLEVGDLLDRQLSPLGERAIEALAPAPAERIVDIGCGAGQTVLQLSERVGPEGQVIGVDIARVLLDRARARAIDVPQARFVGGDAALLDLPDESVDGVFSRFGVMRFADPVAAFANFRRFLKRSGRLAFVCWRALEDNELDSLPLRAAGLEDRADKTPFSFENPKVIRDVLSAAGFQWIVVAPFDCAVSSGGLEEMLTVLFKVGPLGKIVRENLKLREAAEGRVRAALKAKIVDGRVSLNAAVWIVTAAA